jgi:hypothetical protein
VSTAAPCNWQRFWPRKNTTPIRENDIGVGFLQERVSTPEGRSRRIAREPFCFVVRKLSLLFSSTSWQEIVSTCVFINIVARKKATFFLHEFSTTSWH